MKRKKIFSTVFVFIFVLVSFWVTAEDSGNSPVAVSPGSDTEVASVWQSCPTFSWSAVNQAASYRLAIFEVVDSQVTSYADTAAISSPVISKDIPGPALSWTLSSEESLKTGNMYAWYVQAVDAYGDALGNWSNGKIFKVEQEVRFAGIEEKLGEILKSYGVSDETITNVLKDMKPDVKEVVVRSESSKNLSKDTPGKSGVQGYEGETNTFYGQGAGYTNIGNWNTFIGSSAGYYNNGGGGNTFIGKSTGNSNTTGSTNTFIGYSAGYNNTTANGNIFIGEQTGYTNTTGSDNIYLGNAVGYNNTTGSGNIFIGALAGFTNNIGSYNTFFGDSSGNWNTTGSWNTFIGNGTGRCNTTGIKNVFLGNCAGYLNTTGLGNIFLGFHAGENETGSNKLYIANSDTSSPLIYGEFDNSIVTVNGKLGIGTKTPYYPMELETTGQNAAFITNRTDGAKNFMSATASYAQFGSVSNHPARILVNSAWKMMINTDGSLSMVNGATCTAGGTWTNASSRNLKENIRCLSSGEAVDALSKLNPVKYNYKADKTDKHVGFIAEDVPELVATNDRKGLSPMDVTAVLTKVVQEQQKTLQAQQKAIQEQQKTISELKQKVEELGKDSK